MAFRLVNAQFDHETHRVYVELRDKDEDGDEVIVTAIFSFRSSTIYSQRELERDLARKARHMLRKASVGMARGTE